MKAWSQPGIQAIKDIKTLVKFLAPALFNFSQSLTGNITYQDNIRSNIKKSLVFNNGVELGIDHNLGTVPLGFLVVSKNTAADIRSGSSPWTETRINLISNADTVADIIILGG